MDRSSHPAPRASRTWWHPTLRLKTFLVVAAAIIVPQALVMLSSFVEMGVGNKMEANTLDAVNEVLDALQAEDSPGTASLEELIDNVAKRRAVRLRVVAAEGSVVHDANHEAGNGLLHSAGDFFFGSKERIPSLESYEQEAVPLGERDEVLSAFQGEAANGCVHSSNRQLLVCHAAKRLTASAAAGGPTIVYAQESSRRAIRALYDVRYELLKLFLFALPIGLLLAFWLSRSVVGPVSRLRKQVLTHDGDDAGQNALDSGSRDEVGDLAAAFNSLLTKLAERSQQNEAFVADLAHEFKNPVAAIRAAAEKLGASDPLDVERAERLSRILLRSSSQLDRLVSEFLELARAEAGLSNEARSPVDLGELVSGIVQTLRGDERFGGIEFVWTAGEPILVQLATQQIERALANLLENAASYAGADGKVAVVLRKADDHAMVTISDSGPGIAPEALDRIFDRFFTTRAEKRGTGLGLALAKAVVEAHGGSLDVVSTLGKGATFTLRLPFTSDSHQLHRDSSH